jgi:hypothetical protein
MTNMKHYPELVDSEQPTNGSFEYHPGNSDTSFFKNTKIAR